MESINKLREWSKRYNTYWVDPKTGEMTVFFGEWRPSGEYERFSVNEGEKLCELLDEIEQEHERELEEAREKMTVYMPSQCVALPVDADGVPVHIGDVMVHEDYAKPMKVIAFAPPNILWMEGEAFFADMCRHYHEPTVEDMLIKMIEEAVGYSDAHTTVAYSAVSKYAEKLREMMSDE